MTALKEQQKLNTDNLVLIAELESINKTKEKEYVSCTYIPSILLNYLSRKSDLLLRDIEKDEKIKQIEPLRNESVII